MYKHVVYVYPSKQHIHVRSAPAQAYLNQTADNGQAQGYLLGSSTARWMTQKPLVTPDKTLNPDTKGAFTAF